MTTHPTEPAQEHPTPIPLRRRRPGDGTSLRRRLKKVRRRISRAVRWRMLLVGLLVVLAVGLATGAVLVTNASSQVQKSLDGLSRVLGQFNSRQVNNLSLTDFERLTASVNELSDTLDSARRQMSFLGPIADRNADIRVTLNVLDATALMARAGQDMLLGAEPAIFSLFGSGQGQQRQGGAVTVSAGNRLDDLLEIGEGRFTSARESLLQARNILDQLNLADTSESLFVRVLQLDSYHQQLADINTLMLDAPTLLRTALGLDQPQSYLVLAQNNDELRPSGGYISTYGWIRVRGGRIEEYSYSPTTATSPNPPPKDQNAAIQVPSWWIQYGEPIYAAWDGSWYADFSRTAEMARWYYDGGNNPQSPVQGAIGIDITGFEQMLQALGSVTVPGYPDPITPENFRDVVYTIRASGEGDRPHKQFVATVYQQIFSDWQRIARDPTRSSSLLAMALQALREKHVLLYFVDPQLNAAVRTVGWGGAQPDPGSNDYLLVADANLGNKSNRSIARQLNYSATIQADGTVAGDLTISYDYPASVAESDPAVDPEHHGPLVYNNLLQIFLPPQSVVVTAESLPGQLTQATENAFTVLVTNVEVPYDSTEDFRFAYRTPPVVEDFGSYRRYRLLLQKQAGTLAEGVTVRMALPADAILVQAQPAPVASFQLDQPILQFGLSLQTDSWIEVVYRVPD